MNGVFISGTDTGCGKTTVAIALARALRERGSRVRALKPVETGCRCDDGQRIPEDAVALAEAAQDRRPISDLCPYPLLLPAAPSVAAQAEGVELDLHRIDSAYAHASRDADYVIVEGAGGVRVPLAAHFDMLDLCARLRLPLVLVARARLGTINHTLLSIADAHARGVQLSGIVICHTEAQLSGADRQNLDWLRAHCPVPILGDMPYVQVPGSAPALHVDWQLIWPAERPRPVQEGP